MINKLKCVAVDDDPFMLTILEDCCKDSKHAEITNTFTDPVAFVKKAPSLNYDLCLLDIEMPTLNGLMVSQMIGDKAIIFVH